MKARELEVGMTLGRYRLEQRIGEGGMGSVWRARDGVLERDVALKALPRNLVTDASAGRRFEREARAMGRLQHPNVVGIFDIGRADPGTGEELRYLVMELVSGRPLNQVIAGEGAPLRKIVLWMEQVARALGAAHAAGIIHRDLKPSNIMVDDEDHVFVLDFGLARLMQTEGALPEETLTTPGMVLGSCPYMSPEQALGQKVTPQSDLFSFGTVLYEALTRERAYKGETPMRVLQAVVRCDHVPVDDLAPGLPTSVVEIVERCLARDPADRYSNAEELARDLAIVGEMEGSSAAAMPTIAVGRGEVSATRVRRSRRRRRLASATAIAAVLGTMAGLWIGRLGREPVRPDPGRWTMTELYHGSGNLFRPRWSPKGNLIAIARTEASSGEIMVLGSERDDPRVLYTGIGDEVPGAPSFSPDSAALAISVVTGSRQQVRVIPAVGGPPVAEIDNALHGAWLDRSTLVFSRLEDGRSSIWSLDLDRNQERLRVPAGSDGLSWWEAHPRPAISHLGSTSVTGRAGRSMSGSHPAGGSGVSAGFPTGRR
jgi:serine/threonine protein kinase